MSSFTTLSQIDGIGAVLGDGAHSLRIPRAAGFEDLVDGAEVTVGIRPHDVEPVAQSDAADLEVVATLVETLGPDAHVHTAVAGEPFVACLPGAEPVQREAKMRLRITDLHLFDRRDGSSLR